jgi:hypothetical protein
MKIGRASHYRFNEEVKEPDSNDRTINNNNDAVDPRIDNQDAGFFEITANEYI